MKTMRGYRVHPDDPARVVTLWVDPLGRRWWSDPYSADNYTDDEVADWEPLIPAANLVHMNLALADGQRVDAWLAPADVARCWHA
jgi:hypothetical protein